MLHFDGPESWLITGNESGQLHLYDSGLEIATELSAHRGRVTSVCCSYDRRYVFTCGEDGIIFIYYVPNIEPPPDRVIDSQLADVVLIQKSLLEVFKGQLERIRQEIDNLKQNQELKKHAQEQEFAQEKDREEKRLFGEFQAL